MGYTHHWHHHEEFEPRAWTALGKDTKRLIEAFPHPLRGNDANPRPTIDRHKIYIDPGPFGVEHFRFARWVDAGRGPSYCKTEHTVFDELVCAILAVAAMRNTSLRIASDGNANAWQPHLLWAANVLRRAIPCPIFVDDTE